MQRTKVGVNLSFKYPYTKALDFKTVFAGLIAARDKTDGNPIEEIIHNSRNEIIARNTDMLDDKEMDNCDADEQLVTTTFENLYKTLNCEKNNAYCLLDNVSKL